MSTGVSIVSSLIRQPNTAGEVITGQLTLESSKERFEGRGMGHDGDSGGVTGAVDSTGGLATFVSCNAGGKYGQTPERRRGGCRDGGIRGVFDDHACQQWRALTG